MISLIFKFKTVDCGATANFSRQHEYSRNHSTSYCDVIDSVIVILMVVFDICAKKWDSAVKFKLLLNYRTIIHNGHQIWSRSLF